MKSTVTIIFLLSTSAWASSIVGSWKSVSQVCEKNGALVNDFTDNSTMNTTAQFNSDGSLVSTFIADGYEAVVTGSYGIQGSRMIAKLTQVVYRGETTSMEQVIVDSFVLSNDTLTRRSLEPIVEEDDICPIGDRLITTFKRM